MTITQKIQSNMSEVKTALSAPTGIAKVEGTLGIVEETLGDLTEVILKFKVMILLILLIICLENSQHLK